MDSQIPKVGPGLPIYQDPLELRFSSGGGGGW